MILFVFPINLVLVGGSKGWRLLALFKCPTFLCLLCCMGFNMDGLLTIIMSIFRFLGNAFIFLWGVLGVFYLVNIFCLLMVFYLLKVFCLLAASPDIIFCRSFA